MMHEPHGSTYDELLADPRHARELAAAEAALDVTELLELARATSGMSDHDLASAVGVDTSRVCEVLGSGGNIRISTFAKFAHAMGYTVGFTATSVADGHDLSATAPRHTPRRPEASTPTTDDHAWSQTYALPSGVITVPVRLPEHAARTEPHPLGPPTRDAALDRSRRHFARTVLTEPTRTGTTTPGGPATPRGARP